jgi:hypothetical protein
MVAVLAACSQPGPHPASSPAASPRVAGSTPGQSPLPACLNAPAAPPAPAGVRSTVTAWVLASGLDQPDDLWFKDGLTYVGQLGSGHVATIRPGQPLMQSAYVVPIAEGIAFLGDRMFVADQRNDRVDEIVAGQPQTFLQLQPVAGKDNVDGIGVQGSQLLVPDSPNGNVLWVDGAGKVTRTVGGFNRPTGAWPLPDGSVLVADEYGNAALSVAPDGAKSFLVRGLPIVDDVAADAAGRVFVVTPVTSGGRVAELVGGAPRHLAGNLLEPQGLGFDGAGNVLVSETAAGRLDVFIRNFKLVPSKGSPAPGQPLCVTVFRAPGFTGDVQLSAGSGIEVLRQPGAGDVGELLIRPSARCANLGCEVMARSGALADALWITG